MFNNIPIEIMQVMKSLEEADTADRVDGTARLERLRQVPPETGKFIALLCRATPLGDIIEIGSSGGYSALWLSLTARDSNRKVTTFEILPEKAVIARQTFRSAGVEDFVELVEGDAGDYLDDYGKIAFCFIDCEKEDYRKFYDLIIPRLVSGGMLAADNVISHQADLQDVIDFAQSDDRVDAMVVPIGKGILWCRKK